MGKKPGLGGFVFSLLLVAGFDGASFDSAIAEADNSSQALALRVTTSANADSNAAQSFIVVPHGEFIPQGIKRNSSSNLLALQIPFVVEITETLPADTRLQWRVDINKPEHGTIQLLSKFPGKIHRRDGAVLWQSERLGSQVYERNKLVFRPKLRPHRPAVYKKGRGKQGQRRRYGGGTLAIDDAAYNPQHGYRVSVDIIRDNTVIDTHRTLIQMDHRDMIRQEYINHYGIRRYGRGDAGNLPVPLREEISSIPENPASLIGNPLSESQYGLLVNDGMSRLTQAVIDAYQQQLQQHKTTPLRDLKNRPLRIPGNRLWLSGGWRNPERNEWYSNALNGMHQRGGAVDIIVFEPPGHINAAISYWVLWKGLQQLEGKIDGFWQLETNGRPMRTREFSDDIEPENGIPDAFDKADHLHINIVYDET